MRNRRCDIEMEVAGVLQTDAAGHPLHHRPICLVFCQPLPQQPVQLSWMDTFGDHQLTDGIQVELRPADRLGGGPQPLRTLREDVRIEAS